MANEYLTITLTGKPPVKIKKDDWEILAQASENDRHGAQIGNQPNRETDWNIKVRQHADGRAIVYATYSYDTAFQGESGLGLRGGELLDAGADIPAAIERVADIIAARLPDGDRDAGVFARLAQECIADLPAVEI
jgi:hypothetical protein